MQYKFYTNSEKAWGAMYKSIQQAKYSVYLEMYIIDNLEKDLNLFDLFIQKANEGVKFKLIIDSFGNNDLKQDLVKKLKESNIEILFISYLFHRLHKKLVIIDEKIAFIGGVNFHNKTRKWKDITLMIKSTLVLSLIKSFAKSYKNAGGKDLEILKKVKFGKLKKIKNWIIDHIPSLNKFKFKEIYQNHINNANFSILLVTPYLVPKRWMVKVLHQAVLRGVLVEIIIPKNTDHGFYLDRVNYFYINKLSRLGVKIYLDNKMNHAKALLVDNKEGIVGSQNLDFLSFDWNTEIGVFFNDKGNVKKLQNILEQWKKESRLFHLEKFKTKWQDYLIAPILRIFYRIF